jgi:hypothetical protein
MLENRYPSFADALTIRLTAGMSKYSVLLPVAYINNLSVNVCTN